MKKKILSLLIVGMLFVGIGLNADCLAAPHHRDNGRNMQHKALRHRSHSPQKVNRHKKPKQKVKKAPQHKKFQMRKHKSNVKPKQKHRKTIKFFHKKHNKPEKKHHIHWKNPFRRR